jgi:hypothetical protein
LLPLISAIPVARASSLFEREAFCSYQYVPLRCTLSTGLFFTERRKLITETVL